ncbi:MAG: hypothetical protein COW73_03260 [Nitrospirae bacterium CG18_big_fil_WC_8_21_14_2_50_70_55]|nr:PQQ-binding-like beta-propeller repeat protein [Deltaproteobacteria bacterium]OIP64662.1 MAG: hypothetical protein AUK30_06410 [Nitrospirae bacterium CG2_30_70_394]PIQ06583.1 MAG: hypothetical protein COW73_03260 [Nitrospirae bacterium CG18_big_fil_WC_8_21_14_2_50_70_55]PIU77310.1 MAG: hypothetical protein COS73_11225 [Nitrospirae bacterium CG06_land_8_20_14_3_00_70_43]PIW83764.1 MAG: hypothetical protein COZ96_01745 [Nitrospirae bacterium CG_4_8_14_3_um_filter_70_85]PIX82313.1 MAG: hypothe
MAKIPRSFTLPLLLSLARVVPAHAATATVAFEIHDGIRQPESVLYEAARQRLIIANMGGGEATLDDHNGFLAVADLKTRRARRWAGGLSAPKGMGIAGEVVVVADIHRLVAFDLATGAQRWVRELPGAEFLNDIAVGTDRTLYCSDTATHRIWRLRPGGDPEPFVDDPLLDGPNGLAVDGDRLLVATWGHHQRGRVVAIDLASRRLTDLFPAGPFSHLDGIVAAGHGHWLVTDHAAGTLLRLTPGRPPQTLLAGVATVADLAVVVEKGLALLPILDEDRVIAVGVAPPAE